MTSILKEEGPHKQLNFAKELRDFILINAPRNSAGELIGIYLLWVGQLNKDIDKAEAYFKAAGATLNRQPTPWDEPSEAIES